MFTELLIAGAALLAPADTTPAKTLAAHRLAPGQAAPATPSQVRVGKAAGSTTGSDLLLHIIRRFASPQWQANQHHLRLLDGTGVYLTSDDPPLLVGHQGVAVGVKTRVERACRAGDAFADRLTRCQAAAYPFTDPAQHEGRVYTFRITEYSEGGRNIVLSRRVLRRLEAMLAISDRGYYLALAHYRAALAQRNSALKQGRPDLARAFVQKAWSTFHDRLLQGLREIAHRVPHVSKLGLGTEPRLLAADHARTAGHRRRLSPRRGASSPATSCPTCSSPWSC